MLCKTTRTCGRRRKDNQDGSPAGYRQIDSVGSWTNTQILLGLRQNNAAWNRLICACIVEPRLQLQSSCATRESDTRFFQFHLARVYRRASHIARVEATSRGPILLLRVGGQTGTLFSAAGMEARIFSWNFCTGYLCLLREVPCHHGRFEGTP